MKLSASALRNGISTADVLTSIVSQNISISALFVFNYSQPRLLQERLDLSTDEEALVQKAKTLRASTSLPFWEALLLSCFTETVDYSRLLREATFHQTNQGSSQRITREEILRGRLKEITVEKGTTGHSS